jgi:hypothetical protein
MNKPTMPIYVGRDRDPVTGDIGPRVAIDPSKAVVIVGRNRLGKDAGIAIPPLAIELKV